MALQPQAAAGNGQVGFVKIVVALHLLVVLLALAGQDENFTGGPAPRWTAPRRRHGPAG